jgi:hypothetical protein
VLSDVTSSDVYAERRMSGRATNALIVHQSQGLQPEEQWLTLCKPLTQSWTVYHTCARLYSRLLLKSHTHSCKPAGCKQSDQLRVAATAVARGSCTSCRFMFQNFRSAVDRTCEGFSDRRGKWGWLLLPGPSSPPPALLLLEACWCRRRHSPAATVGGVCVGQCASRWALAQACQAYLCILAETRSC